MKLNPAIASLLIGIPLGLMSILLVSRYADRIKPPPINLEAHSTQASDHNENDSNDPIMENELVHLKQSIENTIRDAELENDVIFNSNSINIFDVKIDKELLKKIDDYMKSGDIVFDSWPIVITLIDDKYFMNYNDGQKQISFQTPLNKD